MQSHQKSRPVDDLLDQIDNYEQTLGAIIALANVVIFDYSGQAWIAKSMLLDDTRKITPDIVAQIQDYSLVGEAKQSLPRDTAQWDKLVEQITKYDRKLDGWNGKPKSHDISLICNQTVSYRVADFFKELVNQRKLAFTHSFSVVAFNRNSQRQTFIFLKKEDGMLTHYDLDSRLTEGISVPLERVVRELSAVKFYDAEPNVVYTMAVLWDHVFPRLATPQQFRESRGRKTVHVDVNLDHLTNELRTYFAPPGNRDVVERQWVKISMDSFVRIGLATRNLLERDRYTVAFKRIPQETTIEYFVKKLYGDAQFKLEEYFTGAVPPTQG